MEARAFFLISAQMSYTVIKKIKGHLLSCDFYTIIGLSGFFWIYFSKMLIVVTIGQNNKWWKSGLFHDCDYKL